MINERYSIVKKLGQGRSKVYLCKDKFNNNTENAIKVISGIAGKEEKRNFLKEYYTLSSLEHPSIIKVREQGKVFEKSEGLDISSGDLFFTEEYFNGKDLNNFEVHDEGLLTELILQISAALYYLHQSRFIFYDLKPENILFSFENGSLEIKLIDFGLAKYNPSSDINRIAGSAEYIAPEVLKKEQHDHRIDLYSFGIILYKIIYSRFPFPTEDELEIYRAHVEDEFSFPESEFSEKITSVVRKLLKKLPEERYSSALGIIFELAPDQAERFMPHWGPSGIFSNRVDVIRILKKYLSSKEDSEVITIKGSTGAGKTAILKEFSKQVPNQVYITYDLSRTGNDFIKDFLLKILYSPGVYKILDSEQISKVKSLVYSGADNIIEEVKSVISSISRNTDFTLLFDNFNEADKYVQEIFRSIVPILQVNKHKLILTENIDKNSFSVSFQNIREINLTPFTENHLSDYLHAAYADYVPTEEIKRMVLLYADLLPGNVTNFLKDLLLLKIISYSPSGITIDKNNAAGVLLQTSHENIYKLRLNVLSSTEKHVLNFISAINIPVNTSSLERIIDNSVIDIRKILQKLTTLNIIYPLNTSDNIKITSESLKKYIYKNIKQKKNIHLLIADSLSELKFNRLEIARHYELSGKDDKAFANVYEESKEALSVSAFGYAASLLEKLVNCPVDVDLIFTVKKELAEVYYNLGRFHEALTLLNELLNGIPDDLAEDLQLLKSSCYIGNGDYEKAKSLLLKVEPILSESSKRRQQIELANADFELSNYENCKIVCGKLINNKETSDSDKAKCFNIIGLINIFSDNNQPGALDNLFQAEKLCLSSGNSLKAAITQMNIGNIYNMKRDTEQAEFYWNKSFKTITSIGNLEFEAKLLMNFGIFYFDQMKYEESISNYHKALAIFESLGNIAGEALALYNMGEIYFVTCEYQKSIELLNSSVKIFSRLKNLNEELESLFLLAKVYYIAGDFKQFKFITEIILNKTQKEPVSEKHKLNCSFLRVLVSIADDENILIAERLKEIIVKYGEFGDKINYVYSSFITAEYYIKKKLYEEAYDIINDEILIEYCKDAPVLIAEKNYIEGLIAKESDLCVKEAFDYFLDAADFLQTSSIFEITWKVFYNLGELYKERGSLTKAEEYFIYTRSVLEYILNIISDSTLRYSIINSPARKKAFRELVRFRDASDEE